MANQIEESKKKPLRRLLNGLGISHVGKKTAQDLVRAVAKRANHGTNLEDLTQIMTDEEFLVGIYGIGEKSVESIKDFFSDKDKKKLLHRLETSGVNFDSSKYAEGMLDTEHAK